MSRNTHDAVYDHHNLAGLAAVLDSADELVKVSPNDTTPGYLNGKLVAGSGITLTEGSDGSNETLAIAATGGGGGGSGNWKAPVRVATVAGGTLSTAFENGDVVDGVTLATGDRILLKNQGTSSQNGIYTVNASGSPTRATDFDGAGEAEGAIIPVRQGTANGNTVWGVANSGAITIGTTGLTFAQHTPLRVSGSRALLGLNISTLAQTSTGSEGYLYMEDGFVEIVASGWVKLAPNDYSPGGSTEAKVYIEGGHGLVLPKLTADPSGANSEDAQMYYNTTTHKFRGRASGTWVDLH